MEKNKIKLLNVSKDLRGVLKTIENLLNNYNGIDGNRNYVRYCMNKSMMANDDDATLKMFYHHTYNMDMSKRKDIDLLVLSQITQKHFKLLGDIDTASDIFKPKWCTLTSAVNELHRLRWLHGNVND